MNFILILLTDNLLIYLHSYKLYNDIFFLKYKFLQFLNFVSFKYKIGFDDLTTDFKEFVTPVMTAIYVASSVADKAANDLKEAAGYVVA